MRITIRNVDLHRFGVTALIVILLVIAVVSSDNLVPPEVKGTFYIISFIPIGIFAIWNTVVAASNDRFSLTLLHWFFVLVFFVVAPVGQYLTHSYRYLPRLNSLLMANILLIIWVITYAMAYTFTRKRFGIFFDWPLFTVNLGKTHQDILAAGSLFASSVMILVFGPSAYLTRASRDTAIFEIFGEWGPISQFLFRVVRPFALLAAVVLVYNLIKRPRSEWDITRGSIYLITILLALYVNNPTGGARFYALSVGFGLLLLITLPRLRNGWIPLILLGTALPISQFFAVFRRLTSLINRVSIQVTPFSYFLTPTFDAHENWAHTISYTSATGFEWGSQMLGAVLFFIPRSMWENKPVGSGRVISAWLNTQGYNVLNPNIGVPLPAEFYLNFGVGGVLIGAVVTGFLLGTFDNRLKLGIHRYITSSGGVFDLWCLLGVFLTGFVILVLRGGLLSSLSFLVLFVLAWMLVVLLLYGVSTAIHQS